MARLPWLLLLFSVSLAPAQTVLWVREGATATSLFGWITALGDQNGDGLGDWAVMGGHAPIGEPDEPRYEFFHGGNPPSTTPYWVRRIHPTEEVALGGIYKVGDVNGDAAPDWMLYSWLSFDPLVLSASIYYGGPVLGDTLPDIPLSLPSGSSYLPIGDFNGDGFGDLLLSDGSNDRAFIYYGGNPMDTLPDWTRDAYLGYCTPGDLNGDGYSDFVSSAYGSYLEIYLGGATPDTMPALHWMQGHSEVVAVTDLNGDDYDDIARAEINAGVIYWGGPTLDTAPDATLTFPAGGSGPFNIASAGDFNDDGFHDVVMWAEGTSSNSAGLLTLHLGHPWLNPEPVIVIQGWQPPFNLIGIKVAVALGDVNGDGVDDLGVGANWDLPADGRRGKAVVFAGSREYVAGADTERPELPQELTVTAYPNPCNASTTIALDVPANAGATSLTVFNLLGQVVHNIDLGRVAGRQTLHYDARSSNGVPLASGVYLLRVASGNLGRTIKLMVTK